MKIRFSHLAGLLAIASTPLFAQQTTPEPSHPSQPTPAAAVSAPTAPLPKISWGSVHVDGPYIALTFDDGPSAKLTPQLLKILADRHIKATFFLIGENVAKNPGIVKEEVAAGMAVGSHTWDHPNLGVMSDDKVRSELQRTDDAIFNAAGVHPKMLRPPYGSLALGQRRWVNKEFGYKIIFWSVDPLDWKDPGASVVASRILAATKPGSIILSHDIHAGTVQAMPEVIDTLLAKGYKFVTVPELLAMNKPPSAHTAAAPASSTPAASAPASTPEVKAEPSPASK